MSEYKNVGLFARGGSDLVQESLRAVDTFLRERDVNVYLEHTAAEILNRRDTAFTRSEIGSMVNLVIAVGGDGNMLGAARELAPHGVPLLGINRGRLGFLADVSPDEIELRLEEVLSGQHQIEEHFLLEGEITEGSNVQLSSALNEIIVHSAAMARMIEINLFIDDVFVYNQFSDGLIISSPTGSTAYALSAGGPIMHPSLDAMVLIPMFPHSLNSRPLVVPGGSELRIELGARHGGDAKVSFDSQMEFQMTPGESVRIRKMNDKLKLIHPPGHSFYGVCRSKLDWAIRKGD
ncbi:MAG: NAD(+) kinase [Gammaproteobacteria bacterium]|jgi:NAD+ kinase|nr:NAD(+) kinase [Gammaproteobacteria bacterium]MBT5204770.1 NAD(+) kinase [Gammaproteobacteria bacterium]MBT5601604.1 NAD(+) kinase [Gammaproteobacteria bacterium]MBT6244710.1 NAD(+) kinase [Gammaproteobacteria bacterium]